MYGSNQVNMQPNKYSMFDEDFSDTENLALKGSINKIKGVQVG